MKFVVALNEAYLQDRYRTKKFLGVNYYSGGIFVHVEDTEINYELRISKAPDSSFTVDIEGKGRKKTPKMFNRTLPSEKYEEEGINVEKQTYTIPQLEELMDKGGIYARLRDFLKHEGQRMSHEPLYLSKTADIIKKMYYSNMKTIWFKYTNDEIQGEQLFCSDDNKHWMKYAEANTLARVTQRQEDAKKRKVVGI